MTVDSQAQEMATYSRQDWLRWERLHCTQEGGWLFHRIPRADCPICRWGCQLDGCGCRSQQLDTAPGRVLDSGQGK